MDCRKTGAVGAGMLTTDQQALSNTTAFCDSALLSEVDGLASCDEQQGSNRMSPTARLFNFNANRSFCNELLNSRNRFVTLFIKEKITSIDPSSRRRMRLKTFKISKINWFCAFCQLFKRTIALTIFQFVRGIWSHLIISIKKLRLTHNWKFGFPISKNSKFQFWRYNRHLCIIGT